MFMVRAGAKPRSSVSVRLGIGLGLGLELGLGLGLRLRLMLGPSCPLITTTTFSNSTILLFAFDIHITPL